MKRGEYQMLYVVTVLPERQNAILRMEQGKS